MINLVRTSSKRPKPRVSILFLAVFSFQMVAAERCLADYFVAPTMSFISWEKSSGQSATDTTFGIEGLYIVNQWMAGLKFDHWGQDQDGNSMINVTSQTNILTAEVGWRVIDSNFSPYLLLGAGPYFQAVTTKLMGTTSNDYNTSLAYKLGVGTLGKIADNWALGFSIQYFPQSFINSLNYVFSAGYYF